MYGQPLQVRVRAERVGKSGQLQAKRLRGRTIRELAAQLATTFGETFAGDVELHASRTVDGERFRLDPDSDACLEFERVAEGSSCIYAFVEPADSSASRGAQAASSLATAPRLEDESHDPAIASDQALRLVHLLPSSPVRFREKNRRILEAVAREERGFASLGSLLLAWCHDDIESFDEPQRDVLCDVLEWYVKEAGKDPADAAYFAILSLSHVPARVRWRDSELRVAFRELLQSLRRHVRGGEGTSHVQQALVRLRESGSLDEELQGLVSTCLDQLWQVEARSPAGPDEPRRSLAAPDSEGEGVARAREGSTPRQLEGTTSVYRGNRPLGEFRAGVAVLIDLENLVYGLRDEVGDERLGELFDIDAICSVAREFGELRVVHAYADWKYRVINQFQRVLYSRGVELVHVLGRGRKNAADVRMAVDIAELMWSLPEIETYVIVSGDRDFIEIVKRLRRRGKRIIGIANPRATSADFLSLFDAFIDYQSLPRGLRGAWGDERATTFPAGHSTPSGHSTEAISSSPRTDASRARRTRPEPSAQDERHEAREPSAQAGLPIAPLREALAQILAEHSELGVKGARIKPLLRETFDPEFHERRYGQPSLLALLEGLRDIARIEIPVFGGDITVFEKRPGGSCASSAVECREKGRSRPTRESEHRPVGDRARELASLGRLGVYRYEPRFPSRRAILRVLHRELLAGDTFTWERVIGSVLSDPSLDSSLSATVLSKYQTVLYQGGVFEFVSSIGEAPEIPVRQRPAVVLPAFRDEDAFIARYEGSIVGKVASKLGAPLELDDVRALLGILDGDLVDADAYCRALLLAHETRAGE